MPCNFRNTGVESPHDGGLITAKTSEVARLVQKTASKPYPIRYTSDRMLELTKSGLYSPLGQFYIDPSRAVDHAVITHAHSDHARKGSRQYYCVASGAGVLRARLGPRISLRTYEYGESFRLNGVDLSFHPAGHILGSSQVRMQKNGEVWAVSGDFKREFDPTCEPFQSVKCDVFVTEATFGTPGYRWPKQIDLAQDIMTWWKENAARGENSVLFAYSLGKAQRVLGLLEPLTQQKIHCHPSVTAMNECYRAAGVRLASTACLSLVEPTRVLDGALVLVPPSFLSTPRAQVLGDRYRTAFASGWMARGSSPRSENYDHGFVMSDHADWDDLVRTVLETGARRIYVQHRGHGALVRHLRSLGLQAFPEEVLRRENETQLELFF